MKKFFTLWILLAMLEGLFTGCGEPGQTTGTTQPSDTGAAQDNMPWIALEEGYFELLCENCSIDIYLQDSGARFIVMWLIADRDLTGETVSISTDLGTTFSFTLNAPSAEYPIPSSVYCSYQGISWAEVAANSEKELAALEQARLEHSGLGTDLPLLYGYHLTLPLDALLGLPPVEEWDDIEFDFDKLNIHSVTVTIGDRSKTYDVGLMQFRNELSITPGNGGLKLRGGMAAGYNTDPSTDGVAKLPEIRYYADVDLVLENIYVAGETGVQVQQVEMIITAESGASYNMKWDGVTPLEVDAGSTITMFPVVQAANMANTLSGNVVRHFVLQYHNGDGVYQSSFQMSWLIYTGAFDVYAGKVDGVDMLPYYLDYVNALHEIT